MDSEIPPLAAAGEWKTILPAVSLTFGIIASITFALRAYASRLFSCKIPVEDILMCAAVALMWGTIAAALTSKQC